MKRIGSRWRNIVFVCVVLVFETGIPLAKIDFSVEAWAEGKGRKTGTFTAYSPSRAQTDRRPNVMASGKKPYVGAVACPRNMEFGTRIRIEGMGEYTCEDRMHPRYRNKNRFDILMKDRSKAIHFGVKQLRYDIVNK